jgi:excisionase family DNA binding protein
MPAPVLERAIGLVEVADLLDISLCTARRIAQRGDIAGLRRVGGQWRVLPSDLHAYMKAG